MTAEAEKTLYVVAYDIPSDRRRNRIHRILCGFGRWTQYSLFECFLTRKQLVELQARLNKKLEPEEDSVRFYPLCQACLKRVEIVGSEKPREEVAYVL
jgi:CRISPR-associated protein Cas2